MLYEKWERQQGAMLIIYWMPNTITLNTGPDNQIQVSEGEVKETTWKPANFQLISV